MHANQQELIARIAGPLGWFYLAVAAVNLCAVWFALRGRRRPGEALAWLGFAVGFSLLGSFALGGRPLVMPEGAKNAIDSITGPVTLTVGSFVLLVVLFFGRRFFVHPAVAWTALNGSLVLFGASMTDPEFAATVMKPDNVPIVAMAYLLGFFTWLGAYQAVRNDRRLARGLPPLEHEYGETVLVWPDLVYVELIGMIVGSVLLIVWSMTLRAPLEGPANPVLTPNPSKAPWYFVGLQEMLQYFDPPIAGVVLPALVILGLMAIPYLDPNPEGSGYYTIGRRRFAYVVFQFGFLQLWILLILIGVFMRGPNWSFFGPYEPRDLHKIIAATNIKLSEYFWVIWLDRPLPQAAAGTGILAGLATALWREIAGVVFLAVYFLAVPLGLRWTLLKDHRRAMGRARYWITMLLLLMMLMLPIKMVLHWTLDLSYIVAMPEYYFNF